jgi:hypothetical protein
VLEVDTIVDDRNNDGAVAAAHEPPCPSGMDVVSGDGTVLPGVF